MKRSRAGFTIAELLIVVAIIAVILSVSVPSIVRYARTFRKNALDFCARELYLQALNRLVCDTSMGSREVLDKADFCDERRAYYVSDASKSSELLSIASMIQMGRGAAVVAVTKGYITVNETYYSEDFDAAALSEMVRTMTIDELRNHQQIGFHGGDDEIVFPEVRPLVPHIEIINGDELYLDISCENLGGAAFGDLSMKITLVSDNYELCEDVFDLSFDGETLRGRFVVDKLFSNGESSYINTYSPMLGLPDSITAKIRIYQKTDSGLSETAQEYVDKNAISFSPLFASKNGGSIDISCLRHLHNLRYLEETTSLYVKQIEDINFRNVLTDGLAPIDFDGVFDGGDRLIINPKLRPREGKIGIFGSLAGTVMNTHVVGDGRTLTCELNGSTAGAILCGVAENGSVIENCSVSGISIDGHSNGSQIDLGGIAGIAKGSIVRCSSSCDLYVSGAQYANIGGVAGRLDGGEIENSHSSGQLRIDGNGENSRAAGIAVGSGSIKSCYSECSVGSICGAEYFGISDDSAASENCFYLAENAWLAVDRRGALTYSELCNCALSGFDAAEQSCAGTEMTDQNCPLPESVTVNGIPTRFGDWGLCEPRGIVGIMHVEYKSGEYINGSLAGFDAYDNNCSRRPTVIWDDPREGECRYYLYYSTSSAPLKDEDGGINCLFDGRAELGEEHIGGEFTYQQILLDSEVINIELSFKNAKRNVTIEGDLEEVSELGRLGVTAVVASFYYDYDDDWNEYIENTYSYYYFYHDFATGEDVCHDYDYADDETQLEGMSDFTYQRRNEYEDDVRIYVIADIDSEALFGSQFMLSDAEFGEPFEVSGIYYHEWLGGFVYDERFTVDIDFADGSVLSVPMTITQDWLGYINVMLEYGIKN